MIQVGTILKVCDKTGVMLVQCIKVLGDSKKKIAFLGDVILVSVQRINPKKFHNVKLFKKKRFFVGTLHRALIVRAKVNFTRLPGIFIKFDEILLFWLINVRYPYLIVFMVQFFVNCVCGDLLLGA